MLQVRKDIKIYYGHEENRKRLMGKLTDVRDVYRVFIKYCVFSKNSRRLATSPSPAFGRYWLYKK